MPLLAMHIKSLLSVLLLSLILLLTLTNSVSERSEKLPTIAPPNTDMIAAAVHFLNITPEAQQKKLVFPFEHDERTHWNFVPMTGKRKGLSLKEMSDAQRIAVHALLQSVMSTKGYLKTTGVQQLERILGVIEENPTYRDHEAYFLTLFGTPSEDGLWGWRFEGHHLSLNFSSIDNQLSVVPAFMGSNPSKVLSGPYAGLRVLHEEIDVARALMATLTTEQQSKTIIADKAPRDIITGNDREAVMESFEGLSYAEMNESQQQLLMSLIKVYAGNVQTSIALEQLDRIEEAGYENLYFAWAGSLTEGKGHYYRIHGPTLLIEYDNTQTQANHIHTVWRDLSNDFGRDLLHDHYNTSATNHGH